MLESEGSRDNVGLHHAKLVPLQEGKGDGVVGVVDGTNVDKGTVRNVNGS